MRRFWLILGMLWGTAVFLFAPRVLAHTELVSASPAPGSTVNELTEIRLTFSEPIGPGGQIELLQNFVPVAVLEAAAGGKTLVTAVPPLPDGLYTVQWAVTSADGHPISGSYSLAIDKSMRPQMGEWLTRWALPGVLLAGVGLVILLVRRRQQR